MFGNIEKRYDLRLAKSNEEENIDLEISLDENAFGRSNNTLRSLVPTCLGTTPKTKTTNTTLTTRDI